MVAISVALLEEARVVIRRTRKRRSQRHLVSGRFGGSEVSVLAVGIGGTRLDWFSETVRQLAPALLLNTGFAGATRTLLRPGDLVAAANFSSAELVETVKHSGLAEAIGEFAAISKIAGSADKKDLGGKTRCLAIDMESAALAEVGRQLRIPFLTVRMISDTVDEEIPSLFTGTRRLSIGEALRAARFGCRMLGLTARLAERLEVLLPLLAEQLERY